MSTWFREITMLDEPSPFGVDGNNRVMWSFNFLATQRPSVEFEHEVVTILVAAGVGTYAGSSRDIFVGPKAQIPAGEGPYLTVDKTEGTAPEPTQNAAAAYQQPSAQITVRATSYKTARTMIWAAYNALVGVQNESITAA